MVSRRKFLTVAGVTALAVPTQVSLAGSESPVSTGSLQLTPQLIALEARLQETAGHFSWELHNELRHYYLEVSERMSRMHADVILSRSIFDTYIMNTLSDWHLTDDQIQRDIGAAVAVLLNNVEQYKEFHHLVAACLIKAGDIYREAGQLAEARQLYGAVQDVGRSLFGEPVSTLRPYYVLAQTRLTF